MEEANNLKTEYKRMLAAKDVAHDVAKNDPALRRRMDFASAKNPDSRPIVNPFREHCYGPRDHEDGQLP